MATVTLDAMGRLIRFRQLPKLDGHTEKARADWPAWFAEAALDYRQFVPVDRVPPPLVPHDARFAWSGEAAASHNPVRATGATIDGHVVFFQVSEHSATANLPRNVFSTHRTAAGEAVLWTFIV
jgi:hypothetical protein